MPIYVDSRGEGEKQIAFWLESNRYPVEVRHIDSGDYVIGELAIERKTIPDLISSVMTKMSVEAKGHNFWNQIKIMKDTYKKVIVIIEGYINWDDRILAGIIYGLVDGWQVPYINTMSTQESAKQIGRLFDRYGRSKTARLPPVAVKKGYTVSQIKWLMLQTIPKLGGIVAKRFLDENLHVFSSHEHTYNFNIQGMHKDSKEMLRKILE